MPKKTTLAEHDESVEAIERGSITEDDGIQDGAEEDVKERPKSRREEIAEKIAAQRLAETEGQDSEDSEDALEDNEDTGGSESELPDDEQVGDETEVESSTGTHDPETPVFFKDGKWYAKRKIDGHEEDVPFDELLATNQKAAAADARLRQAAAEQQKIQAYYKDLQDYEQRLVQTAQAHSETAEQERKAKQKDLAAKYRQALDVGNEDEADEYLVQLTTLQSAPTTPAIDPQQMLRDVGAQADRIAQMRIRQAEERKAVAEFKRKDENRMLLEDPHLYRMVDQTTDALASDPEWKDKSPAEQLEEAANRTRKWMQKFLGASPKTDEAPKSNNGFDEKRDKVRAATGNTASSTGTRAGKPATTRQAGPQSVRDYIKERRKAHSIPTFD